MLDFKSSMSCLVATKIVDRILIFYAKLSIVSCEFNVVPVLIVPDSSNYDYFLRLF